MGKKSLFFLNRLYLYKKNRCLQFFKSNTACYACFESVLPNGSKTNAQNVFARSGKTGVY